MWLLLHLGALVQSESCQASGLFGHGVLQGVALGESWKADEVAMAPKSSFDGLSCMVEFLPKCHGLGCRMFSQCVPPGCPCLRKSIGGSCGIDRS